MKSITIHKLDDTLESMISEEAKNNNESLNETIKKLLKKSLGLEDNNKTDYSKDFIDFYGIWKEKDFNEFNEKTKRFSETSLDEWK